MAVRIRLRRIGRKKLPVFSIVAADVRSPRDGRFIEDLGRYYPLDEPSRIELKRDRVLYWLEVGAQPSETVRSLLSRQGILLNLHLKRKGESAENVEEAVSAHRARHAAMAEASKKVTASELRRKALEAEAEKAAKREAKLAEARRRAAAEKRAREEAAIAAAAEAAKAAESGAAAEA